VSLSHLCVGLPSGLIPSGVPTCICLLPCVLHTPSISSTLI